MKNCKRQIRFLNFVAVFIVSVLMLSLIPGLQALAFGVTNVRINPPTGDFNHLGIAIAAGIGFLVSLVALVYVIIKKIFKKSYEGKRLRK